MKKFKRLLTMALTVSFALSSLLVTNLFVKAEGVLWTATAGTPSITTNGNATTIVVADNASKTVLDPTTELNFKLTLTDMPSGTWSFLRFNSTEMTGGYSDDGTGFSIQPIGGSTVAWAIAGTDSEDFTMSQSVTYLITLKRVDDTVKMYVDGNEMISCTNETTLAAFDGTHNIYVWCGGGGGTYTIEFLKNVEKGDWSAASGTPTITKEGDDTTITIGGGNSAKSELAAATEININFSCSLDNGQWAFLRFNNKKMNSTAELDGTGLSIQPLGGGVNGLLIDGTDNNTQPLAQVEMETNTNYQISIKKENGAVNYYVNGLLKFTATSENALNVLNGTNPIYVWLGGSSGTFKINLKAEPVETVGVDYGEWYRADPVTAGSNCTITQNGDSAFLNFDGVSQVSSKDTATVKLHSATALKFSIKQDEYISPGSWHMIRIGKKTHNTVFSEMDAVEFYIQYESTADSASPAVKIRNTFAAGSADEVRTPNYIGNANYYSLTVENGTAKVYVNGNPVYSSTAAKLLDILNGTDDIYITLLGDGTASYNITLNATMPAGYDPEKVSEPIKPNYDSILITSKDEAAAVINGTIITLKKEMTDKELAAVLNVPEDYQAYIIDSTGSVVASGSTITSDCKLDLYDGGTLIRSYTIVTVGGTSSPGTGDSAPYAALFMAAYVSAVVILSKKKKEIF